MKHTPAKTLVLIIAIACQGLFISGCASGVSRTPQSALTAYKPSAATPLADISIELTPQVREKLKDSYKFDKDALRRVVEQALSGYQLIDASKKGSAPSLDITVTHVRARSTFNAVMWGAMSGNDAIHGNVVVKDAQGKVLDEFKVTASYALGGWAGGQDAMRMNWLYEAFAKEVVREFTGESKKKES